MWESNICCDPLTSKQITVYSQKLGRVRLRFPYIYILHINLPSWRLETYLKLLLRVTHFLLLLSLSLSSSSSITEDRIQCRRPTSSITLYFNLSFSCRFCYTHSLCSVLRCYFTLWFMNWASMIHFS